MESRRLLDEALRIGILYPGHSAEDDFSRLAATLMPPVEVHVVHTGGQDQHKIGPCLETGSLEYLLPGVNYLRDFNIRVCMWACTSGSFVYGLSGAKRQVREIAELLGVPSSSTSLGFLNAVRALKISRVAIAATYPEELARAFCSFLNEASIQVVHLGCMGILTGKEVGCIGQDTVLRFTRENDHPEAEAVLVPDTALHGVSYIGQLEISVRKPVLTANLVTMWEALRLVGRRTPQSGLGRLMEVTLEPD